MDEHRPAPGEGAHEGDDGVGLAGDGMHVADLPGPGTALHLRKADALGARIEAGAEGGFVGLVLQRAIGEDQHLGSLGAGAECARGGGEATPYC